MTHNPDHPAGGAGAVKVKPLRWSVPSATANYPEWRAQHSVVRFEAVIDTSRAACFGRFPLAINGHTIDQKFDTVDAAKAAAQADYEACILSALSPTPPVPEPEAEGEAVAPVMWQWRSRLKGGAWDAWERGRFNQEVPPFAEVEERALYTRPSSEAEIADLRAKLFAEGLEAAAQYLEACDDYGDRHKAAEIRALSLATEEKTELPMSETAMTGEIDARLREACVDWDGLLLPDQAEPRSSVTCGELREAADALERLTAELARVKGEHEALETKLSEAWDVVEKERAAVLDMNADGAAWSARALTAEAALAKAVVTEREACASIALRVAEAQSAGWYENPKTNGCGGGIAASNTGLFIEQEIRARTNGESP